jgi:multicomponent Na+:H+ antiporter subunit G
VSWLADGISVVLCVLGGVFFLAGTVGLLRFPDTLSRLHALTKADNLGLGLIVLGLALADGTWSAAGKLLLIWLLALLAGACACYLIARHSHECGIRRKGGGE